MVSFQVSYPLCLIIVSGILFPDPFLEHFCFFLGWVRLLDTLIAVPQHGVYFGGICGDELVDGTSFILTIIPLQSLFCCFQSGCDRGISELPLPFLVFGCISFGLFH